MVSEDLLQSVPSVVLPIPDKYESKLSGGAVTVSFSNYLPWQVMYCL
jgi:hypothetical protein